ncbi:MAG TPA: hypothetical protein VK629_09580 [Steroidobacteraceae bacterium]|nr:hypothetical protein [Steroidobacteraceae bacterium]
MTTTASSTPTRRSGRRELILAASSLAIGVLVLPGLIYGVGTALLGEYGGGPHLGSFYGDFFRNLGGGKLRAWFIVLAPYLFLWLLRIVFRPQRLPAPQAPDDTEKKVAEHTPQRSRAQPATAAKRREPFVGS